MDAYERATHERESLRFCAARSVFVPSMVFAAAAACELWCRRGSSMWVVLCLHQFDRVREEWKDGSQDFRHCFGRAGEGEDQCVVSHPRHGAREGPHRSGGAAGLHHGPEESGCMALDECPDRLGCDISRGETSAARGEDQMRTLRLALLLLDPSCDSRIFVRPLEHSLLNLFRFIRHDFCGHHSDFRVFQPGSRRLEQTHDGGTAQIRSNAGGAAV